MRRRIAAFLVIIAIGVILFTRPDRQEGEAPTVDGPDERSRVLRSDDVADDTGDVSMPEAPAAPLAGTEGEAMTTLAAASGDGLIRCAIPGAPSPAARNRLPFDVEPSRPFARQHYADGLLIAMVAEPEGSVTLVDPGDPETLEAANWEIAGVLKWQDAFPGEEGRCLVSQPRFGAISGTVRWPDGSPATALVSGCGKDLLSTDSTGHFTGRVLTQRTCGFFAWDDSDEAAAFAFSRTASETVQVQAGTEPTTIALVLKEAAPQHIQQVRQEDGSILFINADEMLAGAEERADEAERLEGQASPFEVALENDGLSDDARRLIKQWRQDERDDIDDAFDSEEALGEWEIVGDAIIE